MTNPVLLYSTAADIRVGNLSRLSKANPIIKDLEQGSAVDFLHKKNLVCWSDQNAELIQCMQYNDTFIGEKVCNAYYLDDLHTIVKAFLHLIYAHSFVSVNIRFMLSKHE